MQDARWEKLKDLFARASELTPNERVEFLDEACGDDRSLRNELETLLDHHDDPGNLLESNAPGDALREPLGRPDLTSRRIGNYTIVRELGVGGMGAVYLAERSDGEFRREVAIKIVKRSVVDAETARRFKQEREILASLEHPNIARLLDGGLADNGEPYLIMEYVKGTNLMSFAGSPDIDTDEKLRLFLKICRAVAYAHQNLTIHRDIKPSNIIVSDEGEPKLLDFGLAKIVDEGISTDATETAYRAFTPAYASPEQIAGRAVNTASDIYSLGVVLYEILTGSKPYRFEGKSLPEILETLTERGPTLPSAMLVSEQRLAEAVKLRGDLDNITLKAMNAEPARRYRTVDELAADIERYLNGHPVSARPNTLAYRASKFVSRNRTAVVSAILVVTALVTGLAVALYQSRQAWRERDRAEKRFSDVRQLSNSLLFEIAPSIERLEGSTNARELLVSRALNYLDSLANESKDDLGLQSELAAAYEKIGELQGSPNRPNISDFQGAIESYRKAESIRRQLPDSVVNRLALAANLRETAAILFVQNDNQTALEVYESALTIFRNLAERNALDDGSKMIFLETRLDHAQVYSANNQHAIAVPLFRDVVLEIEMLPVNPEASRLRAKGLVLLANALSWDGKQSEAERYLAPALLLAESIARNSNDTTARLTAWRVYLLASSIYEGTDDRRSLELADVSRRIAQESTFADPADAQSRQNLAKSYSRLGVVLENLGRPGESVVNLDRARSILEELIIREPKNRNYQNDLGKLFTRYGDAKEKLNDMVEALAAFRRSAETFARIVELDRHNYLVKRDLAQALKSCAKIELRLSERNAARRDLLRADEILTGLKESGALGEFDAALVKEVRESLALLSGE